MTPTDSYLRKQTPEEAFPAWWKGLVDGNERLMFSGDREFSRAEYIAGQAFMAAITWTRKRILPPEDSSHDAELFR